jgi:phage tail sheath protein FI
VYVEEVDTGDKPIEGVSTSTAGMVGVTTRGPVANPTLVTSVADFRRVFGGRLDYHDYPGISYLPLAIEGFFNNGGKRVYVVRVLPDTAVYAANHLFDRGDGAVKWTTTLASVAAKGDSVILVDTPPTPGPTDWFAIIDDSTRAEFVQAQPARTIGLGTPVVFDVAVGAAVAGYSLLPNGAPKTLAAAAHANDTTIQVSDIAGIAVNDVVLIGAVPGQELAQVQVAIPANPPAQPNALLVLYTALAYDHPLAANVQPETTNLVGTTTAAVEVSPGWRLLAVADRTQLPASGDAISIGAAPNQEWHFFFDSGVVTTSTPLDFVHPAGSQVVVATLTDVAAPADRNITADASPGDTSLTLSDRANIVQHTVLRLGPAAGPNEYVVVHATPGGGPGPVQLSSPIRSTYTHGTAAAVAHVANDTTAAAAASTVLVRPAHPNEQGLYLLDAGAFPANTLIRIGVGDLTEYRMTAAAPRIVPVTLTTPVMSGHAAGASARGRSVTATVQAIDRGSWGNCLRVRCADDDPILDTAPAENKAVGSPNLQLQSASGIEPGTILEFYTGTGATLASQLVQKVSGRNGNTVHFDPPGLGAAVNTGMRVRTREFKVTAECLHFNPRTLQTVVAAGMSETIRQLSMDPRHSRYFQKAIGPIPAVIDGQSDGESSLIRVADRLTTAAAQTTIRLGPDTFALWLAGGDDDVGGIVDTTFIGNDDLDPSKRTGIYALKNIDEISIIAVPGQSAPAVQEAVITHCELMRYRVGVLDSGPQDTFQTVQQHRDLFDSKYAALYYPWLEIEDPFPANPRVPGSLLLPPSGHVVGIYARTDINRGVHKAPANEVVQAIDDLGIYAGAQIKQMHVLKEQQDILNPRNINVIRDFRDHGRGLRVWGARCITSDPDWRYINVRRLFCFLERSLDIGTQWVVFEPNDERLWARVRQSVSSFLTDVWRSGALMGKRPQDAFFVKCDTTTMTQGDIDNGRLIMLIGIAPVRPAEFVIIRIGQWAGGSMVQEG